MLAGQFDLGKLWLAVIQQALHDATALTAGGRNMGALNQEATYWLLNPESNFEDMCIYLGLDADIIREGFILEKYGIETETVSEGWA